MAKSFKKNLEENPALRFISTGEEAPAPADSSQTLAKLRQEAPEGYKANPLYIEKKTKRVQLVLQPSVFEKASRAAQREGLSFNEFCNRLLAAIEEE